MKFVSTSLGIQVMDPLLEGSLSSGQASLLPSDAVSFPGGAPHPQNLPQRGALQQEAPPREGVVQHTDQHTKISKGFFCRKTGQSVNKVNLRGVKGPAYMHIEPQKKMTPAGRRKAERMCREASTNGIEAPLRDMQLIHSLPRGAKVKRITLPLELKQAMEILEARGDASPASIEAVRPAKDKNLRTLKRIKDLAIEHLTVEIDAKSAEITQRILEWVMKNPYGKMKSVSIKLKTFRGVQEPRNVDLLLPMPAGTKSYAQKNLQALSLEDFALNSDTVKIIEKCNKIKSLRLEEWGNESALESEKALEAIAGGVFSSLTMLDIRSDGPVLKKIEKASWAPQIKWLRVAFSRRKKEAQTLSGASWASFPALEELRLASIGSGMDPRDVPLLQNLPNLKSFGVSTCWFNSNHWSTLLQNLPSGLRELKFKAAFGSDKEDRGKICQLPLHLAESLHSLTLKAWGSDKERENLFGGSKSFAMRYLDLRYNGIEKGEFESIFSKKFPNLEELDLRENRLWWESATFLNRKHENFPCLKLLKVSPNWFLPQKPGPEPTNKEALKSAGEYLEAFKKAFPNTEISCGEDASFR